MSAYIRSLKQQIEQSTARQPSSLQVRFLQWYNGLPEVARHRAFAMQEFEQALGSQGKYISPVLLELGWQRKRKWCSKKQYHRYWVPLE